MKALLKKAIGLIWILACAGGVYFTASLCHNLHRQRPLKVTPPPFAHVGANVAKIFTLGYKGVYDDMVHLWMAQNLTDKSALHADPDGMSRAIDIALAIEPKIDNFYLLSCFTYVQDLKQPQKCEEISKVGIRLFPENFRIPMMQGYVSLFELNDQKKAAAYYAMAAALPDSPEYVGNLVSRILRDNQNLTTASLQELLIELSKDVEDPTWQKLLVDKYQQLNQQKGSTRD